MYSGNTVAAAVHALNDAGVVDENIYLLTLFCTPRAVIHTSEKFPKLTIITSEIHEHIPVNFGMKYFGTD
jgi:uracil phosphoribosyltransferase